MMISVANLFNNLEAEFGPAMMVALLFGLATLLGFILGASIMGIVGASRRRRARRESEEEQELLQNLLNDTRMHTARLQTENDTLKANEASAHERDAKHERDARHLNTELRAAQMSLEVKEQELADIERQLRQQPHPHSNSGAVASSAELNQALKKALEQGRSEGLEVGMQDGLERGRMEGRRMGLVEGREEGRQEVSRREGASSAQVGASAYTAGAAGYSGAAQAPEPPTLTKRVEVNEESSLSDSETGIIPDDQIIPNLPEAELTANVEAYDLSDLEDLVSEDL